MRYIVSIYPDVDEKVRKIIASGGYRDFNHFVNVAIENQMVTEQESLDSSYIEKIPESVERIPSVNNPKVTENVIQLDRLLEIPLQEMVKTMPEPSEDSIIKGPLWGQFYRFLPMKVGLRVLANMSLDVFQPIDKFRDTAADIAEKFHLHLQEMDKKFGKKFGEKLSASFPTGDRKSKKRFMGQFLIYVRPTDGILDGMLPRLKMVNIKKIENQIFVGITRSGLEFAAIKNPMIDKAEAALALSEEEINYLIDHLFKSHNDEANQISTMLKLINEGITSREGLNEKMGEFYKKYHGQWTDAMISTMRAGLLSRLYELRLVSKSKTGLTVTYQLTLKGQQLLKKQEIR